MSATLPAEKYHNLNVPWTADYKITFYDSNVDKFERFHRWIAWKKSGIYLIGRSILSKMRLGFNGIKFF